MMPDKTWEEIGEEFLKAHPEAFGPLEPPETEEIRLSPCFEAIRTALKAICN